METLAVVVIIICFLIIALGIRMLIRNERVSKFRLRIVDLESKYIDSIIKNRKPYPGFAIYGSMPNYSAMMWDTRKLVLRSYLTEEQIEKLIAK